MEFFWWVASQLSCVCGGSYVCRRSHRDSSPTSTSTSSSSAAAASTSSASASAATSKGNGLDGEAGSCRCCCGGLGVDAGPDVGREGLWCVCCLLALI